ncbi:MAG: integral rane sensor signal transduction histidine kinase [Firmicutes bacterium]|nr:integral rane sensor signal transduction histidine kinase [Bacillota bacterium]
MNSIKYRITGLMSLAVAFTLFLLLYLINGQMNEHFKEYLVVQNMEMGPNGMMTHMDVDNSTVTIIMGPLEETFLASVHKSFAWVAVESKLGEDSIFQVQLPVGLEDYSRDKGNLS